MQENSAIVALYVLRRVQAARYALHCIVSYCALCAKADEYIREHCIVSYHVIIKCADEYICIVEYCIVLHCTLYSIITYADVHCMIMYMRMNTFEFLNEQPSKLLRRAGAARNWEGKCEERDKDSRFSFLSFYTIFVFV